MTVSEGTIVEAVHKPTGREGRWKATRQLDETMWIWVSEESEEECWSHVLMILRVVE